MLPEPPRGRSLPILGLILSAGLFLRAPFFFSAVIDWDESTFILIGQSVVEGHLPYAHLWDVKPPLLFAFFSATIAAFGHNIIGVRIAGLFCVVLTAWLVYLLAARWGARTAAAAAAVLSVAAGSVIESGQATMSEHVMLPALLGAVYVWLRAPGSLRAAAGAGALMAVATLVRSNVVICAIAFAPVVWLGATRYGVSAPRATLTYGAGGLAVLALTSLPFAAAGRLELLWQSAVLAAAARSAPASGLGCRLAELGGMMLHGWLMMLLWVFAAAGLGLLMRRRSKGHTDPGAGTLAVISAALIASIAISGDLYPHYLIQLAPFAAVYSAALFRQAFSGTRVVVGLLMLVCGLVGIASLRPVVGEYLGLAHRMLNGQPVVYGSAVTIARYLEPQREGRPVLLLTDHLAYWLLRTEPPAGLLTHPSVIDRGDILRVMGTTAREQLDLAFAKAPAFVVVNPGEWFPEGEAGRYLMATLVARYDRVAVIDEREVYRRKTD